MKRKRETTIKDLPPEIFNLISKYGGTSSFNPRTDSGPLVDSGYIGDHQKSYLRSSEQGPLDYHQHFKSLIQKLRKEREQIEREHKIIKTIFGDKHPSLYSLREKYIKNSELWDQMFDDYNDVNFTSDRLFE